MYSFGLIIGFYFCSKVSAAKITWRTFYLVSVGLALLDFCLQTFYLHSDLSIQHMLNNGLDKSTIIKKLGRYLSESAASELYEEFAQTVNVLDTSHQDYAKSTEKIPNSIASESPLE